MTSCTMAGHSTRSTLICLALSAALASAAVAAGTSPPERPVPGRSTEYKLMPGTDVEIELRALMATDPATSAMVNHLRGSGWTPRKGPDAHFGLVSGQGPADAFKITTLDFEQAGSKDIVALGRVTLGCESPATAYVFSLTAPSGDFDKAVEMYVNEDGAVARANSFWSCWKSGAASCGATCVQAFVSCVPIGVQAGSWQAYLGCVIKKCGACIVKKGACCACNCKWWCKPTAGCCKH